MNPEAVSSKKDYLLLLPSLIPLLIIFAYPLLRGIILTFQPYGDTGFTFENYVRFFTEPNYYMTIYRTLLLVVPAAVLEMVVAFAITYYLRGRMKGKGLIIGLIIFPLTLGSILVDMGIIAFFKPNGWFNQILLNLGLIDEPLRLLYNFWGTFIALFILGVAFISSNLAGMMDSTDPRLEQAARSLGASEWATFRRVFFPLIRSNVLTVFALNLIMQLGVYTSAILVGNPSSETRTFAVVAFEEAMRHFNYNMANTVAMVMALTQLTCLLIVFWIRRRGYVGSATTFK
ncbi:putative spermidine/putrescine transport system permease protein [Caldalkalibacillus uzonensis]|uniref:Spermidine/putrescine transport system permease protein n=1 Tax=Caldalkalibacillus uzonensis TaxID=353224 RepID=A0ABU0CQF5_9BACI|nr:ABC transporter permease subunit [Caldalkalibacillus uzonensis]MDQ0338609.1 putative spermidine/putrescine transport system permease protein [Caldalkalibacillus uzonensis]